MESTSSKRDPKVLRNNIERLIPAQFHQKLLKCILTGSRMVKLLLLISSITKIGLLNGTKKR